MDTLNVGEIFSNIPRLVRDITRVIGEADVTAYGRTLRRTEGTIRLLNELLQLDSFEETTLNGLNQVLGCLLDWKARLIEARGVTGSDTSTTSTSERFCCLPETTTTSSTSAAARGRPRYDVTQNQIESQRGIYRNWSNTARVLGISRQTLYRRRRQFQMSTDQHSNFDDISDDQLDRVVRDILRISPNAGERILIGALRGRGVRIQRARLRLSIGRIDPIGRTLRRSRSIVRRAYSVSCPNEVWHIDGNHKMIRWRFVIHGAIDGYSRLVTYLHCSTDNKSATVLKLFREATQQYGVPSRVRSDMGVENRQVARFMIEARGTDRSSIITGLSVHNQRIERLWCEVNQRVGNVFRERFFCLEDEGLLDPLDECDMYCLQFVYLDAINEALREFVMQYNHHPLRTAQNQSPFQLWHSGTLESFWSDATGAHSILSEENTDEQHSSGDDGDDGDREAGETSDNHVVVPPTGMLLTDELITSLNDAMMHVPVHDLRGRYTAVRDILLITQTT